MYVSFSLLSEMMKLNSLACSMKLLVNDINRAVYTKKVLISYFLGRSYMVESFAHA
jgi:hypothetical protein